MYYIPEIMKKKVNVLRVPYSEVGVRAAEVAWPSPISQTALAAAITANTYTVASTYITHSLLFELNTCPLPTPTPLIFHYQHLL